jgi:hypothetical protein
LSKPLSFDQVVAKELAFVNSRRARFGKSPSDGTDLIALCLSGGGVRSAAFCLGIIRSLAKSKRLMAFDYLSTVSGGGYAGGFLTRWVYEKGYAEVEKRLARVDEFSDRSSPLFHLRRYVSYLTPRMGLFSLDSLAGMGLFARNLLLNWLVLIPFVIAIIVAVKYLATTAMWVQTLPSSDKQWIRVFQALLAFVLLGLTFSESLRHRPGWRSTKAPSFSQLFLLYGLPLFGASILFVYVIGGVVIELNPLTIGGVASIGAAFWVLAYLQALFYLARKGGSADTKWMYFSGVALAIQGAVAAITIILFAHLLSSDVQLVLVLAPAVFILSNFIGEVVYTGLTNRAPHGDLEREWLSRSMGAQLRLPVIWLFLSGTVIYGPDLILDSDIRSWAFPTSTVVTGTTGIITVWLGRLHSTSAFLKEQYRTLTQKGMQLILAVSLPVFLFGVIALLSIGIDWILSDFSAVNTLVRARYLLVALGALIAIGAAASYLININRFSLHSVYRNRLIRTFLGASNSTRDPEGFVDFDSRDNVSLKDLLACKAQNSTAANTMLIPPQLHIINMAMNVLASSELALQERKALPFSASAIAVGSKSLWDATRQAGSRPEGCYRNADEYSKDDGIPITLGTVMAISGAAFSSNMGYHSSPTLSALLTIANVRLGAWLGNPSSSGNHAHTHDGPRFAIWPLVVEALGLSSENSQYVHLSDGGHFDNLGLYEMLARRCQLILVVDAGCDMNCAFEDLGSATRLAALDLGAKIKFKAGSLENIRDGKACIATAFVEYDEDEINGFLIYVKPRLAGGEPASVLGYASKSETFPHETTVDQWFGESQFNAYVQLGEHIGRSIRFPA